ncbi:MAG TPA: hypothetical protein VG223_07385, partial [Solirubrobacteraceae bacterium]|nr:hypothetical protein [Solirubrobacteraceae bacterium]
QGQTVRVGGCAAATTTLKLSVPVGESFTGVVVDGKRYAAHGSSVRMRVVLGGAAGAVRVRIVEHIRVRGHAEAVRFTRVYRHC